jgi:hypothetical protein
VTVIAAPRPAGPPERRTLVALAGIVAVAAGAYALYAYTASVPRFLLDELYYFEAGTSLGQGDGLRYRDRPWGYGPGYPAVIAPVVRLTDDQEAAYLIVKLLGAVAFAAALVPTFALARRYVSDRSALLVVVLVAVLPSSTYVSLVMTESISFLIVATLWLAMVIALERPTIRRQLGVVALLGAAAAMRTQLAPLALAWLAAIVLNEWLVGRPRVTAVRLWRPTIVVALACGLVATAIVVAGRGPNLVGSYGVLVTEYAVLDLTRSLAHQLASMVLSLAAVPAVAGVAMLVAWYRSARRGAPGAAAFTAVFVPANALLVATVSVFAASEFAVGSLHDRKLFYLYPLWLVLFAAWLDALLPRPRWLPLAGLAVIGLVALLPFGELAAEEWLPQHEAPATEVWGLISRHTTQLGVVLIVCAAVAVIGALALPARLSVLLPVAVGAVLAANATLAWRSGLIEETVNGAGPRGERDWVDRALPDSARVSVVVVDDGCTRLEGASALMTLFFNRTAVGSYAVGTGGVARPDQAFRAPGGTLTDRAGRPLRARYVVASPALPVEGRRLAVGSPAPLVLWETDGVVRVGDSDGCA